MKRGNLLWTGSRMMLTEHRQLLNELLKEDAKEDFYYQIDEQKLEEWQEILNEAVNIKAKIIITLDNKDVIVGYITNINQSQRCIEVKKEDSSNIRIAIDKIIELA